MKTNHSNNGYHISHYIHCNHLGNMEGVESMIYVIVFVDEIQFLRIRLIIFLVFWWIVKLCISWRSTSLFWRFKRCSITIKITSKGDLVFLFDALSTFKQWYQCRVQWLCAYTFMSVCINTWFGLDCVIRNLCAFYDNSGIGKFY